MHSGQQILADKLVQGLRTIENVVQSEHSELVDIFQRTIHARVTLLQGLIEDSNDRKAGLVSLGGLNIVTCTDYSRRLNSTLSKQR